MLSVISDVLIAFLGWLGEFTYFLRRDPVGNGGWIELFQTFFAIGIAASLILFFVKLLHRVSSHGR